MTPEELDEVIADAVASGRGRLDSEDWYGRDLDKYRSRVFPFVEEHERLREAARAVCGTAQALKHGRPLDAIGEGDDFYVALRHLEEVLVA